MRHMLHRAERFRSKHDWTLYRRARWAFRALVRKAKAMAWRTFCESVNRSDMWHHLPRLLRPRHRLHVEDLQLPTGEWAIEEETKADILASRFFPPGKASDSFRSATASRRFEVDTWLAEGWGGFPPITEQEVHRELSSMRSLAAPGLDGIVVRCLQETAPTIVPILCHLFQRMLEDGSHPSAWRIARVLPIPKPDANPHLAKGYRPIALVSVLSKVLEGVVKDRLSHHLEVGEGLREEQQGVRPTRSTELALWRFVSSATRALKTRRRCIAVALDIESAYDTVDHVALLWKLKSKGVPKYLVAWIRAFLLDRQAHLVVNASIFSYDIRVGVPQGSPLSPVLFIIFIDDLLGTLASVVQIQAFADDLLVWDVTSSRGPCPSRLQQALDIICEWSQHWGLTFNPSKCKALDISRLRHLGPLFLHLHSSLIPQVQEFRYLGVWVDATLTWDRQIRETCNACLERLRALRRLCATYWGVHPQVMAVLVQAIVFPHLFYGVCAWGGVGRFIKCLRPIDRVLRLSAILTLGLLHTTSVVKAIAACGWLPADLSIRYELFRFLLRQRTYDRDDLLDRDHVVGVNQTISALDTARGEFRRLFRTHAIAYSGWERLDPIRLGDHAPWDATPPLTIRFPSRESVMADLASAQHVAPGIWIYTDGSLY